MRHPLTQNTDGTGSASPQVSGVTKTSSGVSSRNQRCLALADGFLCSLRAAHLVQLLPHRLLCNMVALAATCLAAPGIQFLSTPST